LLPPLLLSSLFPYTTLFRSNVSALDVYDFRASVRDLTGFCDLDFLGGTRGSFLTHQIVCPPRTAIGSSFFGNGLLSRVYWVSQRSEEHTSELQSRFDLVCRL